MKTKSLALLSAIALAGTGAIAGLQSFPALAQPALAMLGTLDPGEWTLRFRDGTQSRRICVRSGRELIQIRHVQNNCNRYVVEDDKTEVTVQYSCRGNGYGRTSIRRETDGLVQIESQGIVSGQPFQFTAEARRTGPCAS